MLTLKGKTAHILLYDRQYVSNYCAKFLFFLDIICHSQFLLAAIVNLELSWYMLPMNFDKNAIESIIKNALAEDIGKGDITSQLTIPAERNAAFSFTAREQMVFCGSPILELIFSDCNCSSISDEGVTVDSNNELFVVDGSARDILLKERVALNLIQRSCGIATITKQFVDETVHTKAKILDTRKTMPGLRALDKYAVTVGGGQNHRMRLDDGILIKDNHIYVAGGIKQAVRLALEGENEGKTVEVECDTIEQAREAVEAGAQMLLLDNMDLKTMEACVTEFGGKIPLEASGGVNLQNVRQIALTGVDFISVGAITHSAPSMDIGLDEKTV